MGARMTCPGCDAHTSAVLIAVTNGEPCPHCGLSADSLREIHAIRQRGADAEITRRCEEALLRADRAEATVRRLQSALEAVRDALASAGPVPSLPEETPDAG